MLRARLGRVWPPALPKQRVLCCWEFSTKIQHVCRSPSSKRLPPINSGQKGQEAFFRGLARLQNVHVLRTGTALEKLSY